MIIKCECGQVMSDFSEACPTCRRERVYRVRMVSHRSWVACGCAAWAIGAPVMGLQYYLPYGFVLLSAGMMFFLAIGLGHAYVCERCGNQVMHCSRRCPVCGCHLK